MGAFVISQSVDFRAFAVNVKTIAPIQGLYQSRHAIWCYTAPMAIFTFLESYDFTGKTVISFCTSGSSSITQSVTEIRSVCSSANVLDGYRAGNSESNASESVEDWLIRIGQIGNQNTEAAGNALIAYFSLSENTSSSKEEQSGNLDAVSSASVVTDGANAYGNTEYIAKLIQDETGGTPWGGTDS